MYKILLASDGSTNSFKAAEKAFRLAGPLQAEVTVIAVVPKISSIPPEANETMKRNANIVLEKNKDFFDKKGLKVGLLLEYGDPGNIICETADKEDYDLIILGSSGLGTIKELFLGSVCNKVVHCAKNL